MNKTKFISAPKNKILSREKKRQIEKIVKKTASDYGETLKLLGKNEND